MTSAALLVWLFAGVRVEILGDGANYLLDDAVFQPGWKIAGKKDGKEYSLSAEGLVGVRFPGRAVSDAQRTARLLTAAGEVFRGELMAVENDQVKLRGASLGEYRIPLTAVRALALDPELDLDKLQGWLTKAGDEIGRAHV